MILFRYLKQQNWWYAIACAVTLYLFYFFYTTSLALDFLFATVFIIAYSFKFGGKYNNELIDKFKLLYYFLFFTGCILGHEFELLQIITIESFPIVVFFLYSYSILIFYQREMEQKDKKVRTSTWLIIMVAQTILLIGIVIWAITQKVEADKQKFLTQYEIGKAEEAKYELMKANEEALKYQELYQELLKQVEK
jgi:hypothetical protein